MSWRVVGCVLTHHDQKIGGVDLLLLVYVANHANGDDGSGAWPSQLTLAHETGLGRRTIQRALERLVGLGAIEVEQRPGRTHRFCVRMCAVCLPSPSASQRRIATNQGAPLSPGGASEWRTTCATVAHEPFIQPPSEPPNAVGASPLADAVPPARPDEPEQEQSARNRKAASPPPEQTQDGRAAFIARRVEQIRQEQGDRAAKAYLDKVAQNDAEDWRRAEVERLTSGVSPEGYSGFLPTWAAEEWKALHPDASPEQPDVETAS